MSDPIQEYLQQLHQPQHDNAFFSLIEADDAVVPQLIEAYQSHTDSHFRATLTEIIWQHRLPSSLEFLVQALHDEHDEVWKAALDGIVGIGGDASLAILIQQQDRLQSEPDPTNIRLRWIEEAIQQLTHATLA
jgi:HEAT repeat protein